MAVPITVNKAEDGAVEVKRPNDERNSRSLHGLTRTLINNMVLGVTEGYEKKMEIHGTGYRVTAKGSDLEFALGYSHPITVKAPEGIPPTPELMAAIGKISQQASAKPMENSGCACTDSVVPPA